MNARALRLAACAAALAASAVAAGMEDDLGGLIFRPYQPGDPESVLVPRPALGSGIGLRGGLFLPVRAEGDWNVAPRVGVFYRDGWRGYSGLGGELGLDLMVLNGERLPGARVSSTIAVLHYNVIFSLVRWPAVDASNPYLGLGIEFGFENALWQATDEFASRSGGAVNLSAGVTDGEWDTRISYSFFIGHGGARGGLLLTLGRFF